MANYRLHADLTARLDLLRNRMKLSPGNIRVLDFGCGRGRTVAKLMDAGYDAYGVDNDPAVIEKARAYFKQQDWNPDRRIHAADSSGLPAFKDNMFHFIFSEQVFEHVQDLATVAKELYRITAPRGDGYHVFSAPHRMIEEHLAMPLIHWLPKNRLRHALIRICVSLGQVPVWKELEGRAHREIARTYYDYSRDKTFYRNWRNVKRTFESAGFAVSFEVPSLADATGFHRVLLRATRRLGWRFYREFSLDTVALRLDVSKPGMIESAGDTRSCMKDACRAFTA